MGEKKSKFYTRLTLETRFYDNTKQTYVVERNYWDPTLDDMLDMMESLLKAALYDPQSVEEVFHETCEPPVEETDDVWKMDKPADVQVATVDVEAPEDWVLGWDDEQVPEKKNSWACEGCTEVCEDTACLHEEDY